MSSSRKILVIGSNSFSGSDFIDLLLEDPTNDVVGVSRSPEKGRLFLPYLQHEKPAFQFQAIDVNHDMERLTNLIGSYKPAFVVNFAAQSEVGPSWEHPEHWFQTNTVALAKLSNYLVSCDFLERFVHISSPEVYGTCEGEITESAPLNPSTPYAASKAAGDLLLATLVKNFGFPLVTIRATNVYGAHQQLFKIIPRTVISIKNDRIIELHGGGHAVKSYIHIRDISRGELAAMLTGQPGSIYHFSPAEGMAVREVVGQVCNLMGADFERVTRSTGERLGQDAAYVIDSTRARKELGWSPCINFETGLSGVVDWVEEYWTDMQSEPLDYVHQA